MSDTTASLRRKIGSAGDLQSVVRTMKALAASSIGQYEKSVRALGDYYRTVELGLGACFPEASPAGDANGSDEPSGRVSAVVFGSDQGLVGQFNDVVADFAIKTLAALPGKPRSGPSASACMLAWQMRACRWRGSSPCRIPSRPSPRWSDRFSSRAKPATARVKSPNSISSTTAPRPARFMRPSAAPAAAGRHLATRTGRASLADEEPARGHG